MVGFRRNCPEYRRRRSRKLVNFHLVYEYIFFLSQDEAKLRRFDQNGAACRV